MRSLPVFVLSLLFAVSAQAAPPRHIAQPDLATCAMPVYPPEAKANQEEGTTTLAILVGKDGMVHDARVTKSSGHARLDAAALTALKTCHYSVATVDGQPVEIWSPIAYVWTMDGNGKPPQAAQ